MTASIVSPGTRLLPRPWWLERRLGPAWPLKLLLLGFPLWWALGFASFAFLILAVPMALQIWRRRPVLVPAGFGLWVLFFGWMLAGGILLWVHAPGTLNDGDIERLVGFGYRVAWYLAVTVAMLYPLSLRSSVVPASQVMQWLGFMFIVAITGGLAGMLFPAFQFTSLAEYVIPGARSGQGFIYDKVHPALTTLADFLGYEQPRPKAPFTYANAWGNNVGTLLPFFIYTALHAAKPWQRALTPVVLMLAAIPIAFSLNRGLWLGLGVLALSAALVLVRARRFLLLWAAGLLTVLAVALLVMSPLWDTITLRLETPHSNERRGTAVEVVVDTTWEGSPILGYGTTRQVAGSFFSVAGGGTPECRSCAVPPLGTQGFMWRLIFTTGFVGTALFLAFVAVQLATHIRRRDPPAVLGCMVLTVGMLFAFVYDSLESPLFFLMLAVGLMNRERIESALRGADHDVLERP